MNPITAEIDITKFKRKRELAKVDLELFTQLKKKKRENYLQLKS